MSLKHQREDVPKSNLSKNLPVVSKCLVIVLIPKTRKVDALDEDADSTVVDPHSGDIVRPSEIPKAPNPNGYNGKELLHDFKTRNKTCYWNPSLVESIKSLEYKGFVEPSTILVTAADIHLENLRSAWGRRVLKAPMGFTIERIGDVNNFEMQVIPQTQFMPLPDAVCQVLLDLNVRGVTATLDVILEKLALWYRHMTPPSQQLVFDSLSQLIRDRKVFHTGSGYFVVTPETSRLQSSWAANSSYMPSNASWLPYHPMYVPVFQGQMGGIPGPGPPDPQDQQQAASRAHMRSISCQVTTIEDSDEEDPLDTTTMAPDIDREKASTLGRAPRSSSVGRTTKEERKAGGGKTAATTDTDGTNFKRSSSLKHKNDKGKAAVKEAANKPAPVVIEKEKEKKSIFSKIFGRKKKDHEKERDKLLMPPPPPPPILHAPAPSTSGSEAASEGNLSKEKEYVTFSAQFPPPEWMWYQQQLEKQKRTETWVSHQTSKASTATVGPSMLFNGPRVVTRPPVPVRSAQQYASHRRSMASMQAGHENYVAMGGLPGLPPSGAGSRLDMRSIRADNLYESFRNLPPPSGRAREHPQRKSRDMDGRMAHHQQWYYAQDQPPPSEYDIADNPGDVTPLHTSNVYHSVSALSPVAAAFDDADSSTYAKLAMHQPQLGPLHSTPRVNPGGDERAAYTVEGHEARDRIYGPSGAGHSRARTGKGHHRSRRKAQQRIYKYYGGGAAGSDISIEYKGKLPNKNSSRAQSRDSGVNCVGLATGDNKGGRRPESGQPVYENTAKSSNQHRPPLPPAQCERVSNEAEGESCSHLPNSPESMMYGGGDTTSQGFTSVVYGVDSTNQAYNSVVYSSHIDMSTAPSVLYGTIATSTLDASNIAGYNKPSTQTGYVAGEESIRPVPTNESCQLDVNPTTLASAGQVEELHSAPESLVDVVSSPGVRVVSGSSDGAIELAAGDESLVDDEDATALNCSRMQRAGNDGDDEETEEEGEGCEHRQTELQQAVSQHSSVHAEQNVNHVEPVTRSSASAHGSSSQEAVSSGSSVGAKDQFVSDSGFSSPRNPEGVTSAPNVSRSAQMHHSSGSALTATSGGSNVNTATSEQHSSVTHGDSDANFRGNHHLATQPSQHLPQLDHQQQQQQHFMHMYQPSSMVVPHPDVFSNNSSNIMYKEQSPPMRAPLVPNTGVINRQAVAPQHKRSKSIDLWKQNNTPSELHRFEEEQLTRKYGANGEFEVMGVL